MPDPAVVALLENILTPDSFVHLCELLEQHDIDSYDAIHQELFLDLFKNASNIITLNKTVAELSIKIAKLEECERDATKQLLEMSRQFDCNMNFIGENPGLSEDDKNKYLGGAELLADYIGILKENSQKNQSEIIATKKTIAYSCSLIEQTKSSIRDITARMLEIMQSVARPTFP